MATYGRAETGLPDLVKQRKRAEYGVGDEMLPGAATDESMLPETSTVDPFTPYEQGGFTGGQAAGVETGGIEPLQAQTAQTTATAATPAASGLSVWEQLRNAGVPGPWMTAGAVEPGKEATATQTAAAIPNATRIAPADTNTSPTIDSAFNETLLAMLNKPIGASLSDPALKGQADAYSVGQQRSRDQFRDAMAERMAANGISDSGAFDQGIQGLYQQQGENESGFNAKLVGDELTRQRDELQNYMQLAGARLTSQEAQALQLKIAELNASIASQGQTNQNNQFNRSQGFNEEQWGALQSWLFNNGLGA
jgi:hypothetical protein